MLWNARPTSAAVPPKDAAPSPLPRVGYALALDPGQKFGSMEEQIVLLAERFQAEGSHFAPVFIGNPNADASQFHARGIDAQCLDLLRFSWPTLLALREFVRSRRIDVMHWNFISPLANPYVWGLSLVAPKVRAWFTDHNSRTFPLRPPPRGMTRFAKRLLLRRYGRVVCVSQYVAECLADQGVWSNLVSELHFVNTQRFCPDDEERGQIRAQLNISSEFVLLGLGQLIPEKGFHVALQALAELPPHVVLWLVGKGPEEASLRAILAKLGLGERVRFLGQQRHVQPYLRGADCVVCPSLWAEAAGLVNIEAQACGTPVIASRIGGIPEYVDDGQTGLLFPPGDAAGLAQCVRKLLDDPAHHQGLSRAAREAAVKRFSPEARLPRWLDLYRTWRD